MKDAVSPGRKKRVSLWAVIPLVLVVVLIGVLIGGRVFLGGAGGRALIERQLEQLDISGQKIAFDDFTGDVLGGFRVGKITLADSEGVWGEIDDLRVEWQPAGLLSRKLLMKQVSAAQVHVLRRPLLAEQTDKPENEKQEFPLNLLRFDDVQIGSVILDEGVLPNRVSASVEGEGHWAKDRARLDVDLTPEGTDGDLLSAHLGWTRRSPVTGDLKLTGPAGGLFASLLQLDAEQSVEVAFAASGKGAAVNGTGYARINDGDWLSLVMEPDGKLVSVGTTLKLASHPLTRDYVDQVGPEVRLEAKIDPKAREKLIEAHMSSDTAEVAAQNIRLSGARQSADIRIDVLDPAAILPKDVVTLGGLQWTGELAREADRLSADGLAVLSGLHTESFSADHIEGPVSVSVEKGVAESVLALTASPARLVVRDVPRKVSRADLAGQARFDLTTKQLDVSDLVLATPKSRFTAAGNIALGDVSTLSLGGAADINLAELGLYDAGRVNGKWSVKQGRNKSQQFKADVTARGLVGGDDALAEWIGAGAKVSLSGVRHSDGAIEVSKSQVRTDAVLFDLTGHVSKDQVMDLAGQFETSENYPLAGQLPGLKGQLVVNGPAERARLTADVSAEGLVAGENSLDGLQLHFAGERTGEELAGDVALTGALRDQPVSLKSAVSYAAGRWSAKQLDGRWRDLKLGGSVAGEGGSLEALTAELKLAGRLPDDVLSADVDLTFSANGETLAVAGGVTDIDTPRLSKGELRFAANGEKDDFAFSADLKGVSEVGGLPQPAAFTLNGRSKDLTSGVIDLTGQMEAEIGGQVFATQAPFSVLRRDDSLNGQLRLKGFDGELAVQVDSNAQDVFVLNASGLGVAPFMRLIGRAPMEGVANLRFAISNADTGGKGLLTGSLSNLAVPDREVAPVTFLLTGEFDAQSGVMNLATREGQMLQARAEIGLPLGVRTGSPFFAWDSAQSGSFDAQLSGPVDNMMAILLPEDLLLKGRIDADIKGAIPVVPASLEGRMTYRDGAFSHAQLGTELEEINFDLDMTRQILRVSDFAAKGRKGGSLTGSGALDLTDGVQSDIELVASKLVVVNRKEARAVASGTLGLGVKNEAFEIVGDLKLDEGDFRIDTLPSSSAPTLDVRFDAEEEEIGPKRRVTLNLNVTAPHSLKVTGHGMDAELSLNTKITGTSTDPKINGTAKIVRGRFDMLGKRFVFQDSDIRFTGNPLDATLNIVAARQAEDFVAKVTITGTPESPKVALSASPELPGDEVLSRVLFGRSPAQLSAFEAARLAAALASMSGGGGFDLLGGIESVAGLDTLDVSQNANGEFELATGRYLSDDIYLELTTTRTGAPGVSVEWEARDNISVEAETRPDEGQKLTIQWKKDFD